MRSFLKSLKLRLAVFLLTATSLFVFPAIASAHWVARQIQAGGTGPWAIHYDLPYLTSRVEVFNSLCCGSPYQISIYEPNSGFKCSSQIINANPWNQHWTFVCPQHAPVGARCRVQSFASIIVFPGFYCREA